MGKYPFSFLLFNYSVHFLTKYLISTSFIKMNIGKKEGGVSLKKKTENPPLSKILYQKKFTRKIKSHQNSCRQN